MSRAIPVGAWRAKGDGWVEVGAYVCEPDQVSHAIPEDVNMLIYALVEFFFHLVEVFV